MIFHRDPMIPLYSCISVGCHRVHGLGFWGLLPSEKPSDLPNGSAPMVGKTCASPLFWGAFLDAPRNAPGQNPPSSGSIVNVTFSFMMTEE